MVFNLVKFHKSVQMIEISDPSSFSFNRILKKEERSLHGQITAKIYLNETDSAIVQGLYEISKGFWIHVYY